MNTKVFFRSAAAMTVGPTHDWIDSVSESFPLLGNEAYSCLYTQLAQEINREMRPTFGGSRTVAWMHTEILQGIEKVVQYEETKEKGCLRLASQHFLSAADNRKTILAPQETGGEMHDSVFVKLTEMAHTCLEEADRV